MRRRLVSLVWIAVLAIAASAVLFASSWRWDPSLFRSFSVWSWGGADRELAPDPEMVEASRKGAQEAAEAAARAVGR